MSYTVVYYTGGTEMGEWHRCTPVATLDAANDMADSVERMGYVAYCRPTREWDVLGLPEGPPRRAPRAWMPTGKLGRQSAEETGPDWGKIWHDTSAELP